MQAVRNEQEMRCTLGKKYTVEAQKVKAFVKNRASNNKYTTANFTYTLNGNGMAATSDKGYTLEMPFYLDGRICCNACGEFTRNYVTCSELNNEDLQKIKDKDPCTSN